MHRSMQPSAGGARFLLEPNVLLRCEFRHGIELAIDSLQLDHLTVEYAATVIQDIPTIKRLSLCVF